MPTGNTDTRYYWDLSDGQILRYNHRNSMAFKDVTSGVHTVDESELFFFKLCKDMYAHC